MLIKLFLEYILNLSWDNSLNKSTKTSFIFILFSSFSSNSSSNFLISNNSQILKSFDIRLNHIFQLNLSNRNVFIFSFKFNFSNWFHKLSLKITNFHQALINTFALGKFKNFNIYSIIASFNNCTFNDLALNLLDNHFCFVIQSKIYFCILGKSHAINVIFSCFIILVS